MINRRTIVFGSLLLPVAAQANVMPGTREDFLMNIGDRCFFRFDRSDLDSAALQQVYKQAAWITKYPHHTVTIEGHCDERGTREYNLYLGEKRANSVKEQLIKFGVNANQIQTVSYGKERPAVLGSNEVAWSQNRRAVVVIY